MTAGRATASPQGVASPFAGAGTIRALGRRLDWASTALGAPEHWAQSLRTAVDLCLGSPLPSFIWWGPSLVQLYNDAALEVLRTRHPASFAVPAAQAWADVWASVGPLAERVMATGAAIRGGEAPITLDGAESPSAAIILSYGAVRDESGSVAGLFVTASETRLPDQRAVIERLREANAEVAQALDRARASETLTSALVAHLPGAAAFVVDESLRYVVAEGEALTTAGFSPADLVGRTIGEALGERVEAEYAPFYRRALAGETFTREHEDHGRVYLTRGAPLRDGAGRTRAALAISTDITERRKAEESLRRSEAEYRTLFDSIDEGFCVIEVMFDAEQKPIDYRFLETNPAFTRQTGISDAVGRTMREIAPAHEDHWFQTYGRVALTGEPTRFEARADALGRWYDVYAFRVGDPAERRVAILFNDVAPRKHAEAALSASEERYRALATASANVVYSMSPDWSEMRRLDGRGFISDTVETTDTWLARYIHPDDQVRVTTAIQEAVRTTSTFELEHRVLRADGTLGWTSSRAVPVIAPDGAIVEWIGAATDVTVRREVEEALRTSQARQAFLLALNDTLRPLGNPEDVTRTAVRVLGEHLGVDRAFYVKVLEDGDTFESGADYVIPGVLPLPRLRLSDFGAQLHAEYRAGRTLVMADAQEAPQFTATQRDALTAIGARAAVAVPLVKGDRIVAVLGIDQSVPRPWTAYEVALIEDVAERIWATAERARAEAALHASEARLVAVFESLPVGVGVIDAGGALVLSNQEMHRYLPTGVIPSRDPERQARWRGWDGDGRLVQSRDFPGARALRGESLLPGIEMLYTHDDGRELWTRVAGVPIRDAHGEITGGAIVVTDIDMLKGTAEALRAGVERQAFLLTLSDALRPLGDPMAVQAEAMRVLGERFGAVRAQLWEAESDGVHFVSQGGYARGMAPLAMRIRPEDYGVEVSAIFRAGRTLAVADTAAHPLLSEAELSAYRAVDIGSFVGVPLVKDGEWVAVLGLHRAAAHAWTPDEVALVEETAERTWAAVASARAEAALRASEAKYRTIFNSIDEGFGTHEVLYDDAGRPVDIRYLETNAAYERHTGVSGCVGRTAREILVNNEDVWLETFARVARSGEPLRFEEYNEATSRWYNVHLSRVGDDGSPVVAAVFADVTERRRAEATLAAAAARDAFLIRLADALRPLVDPFAVQEVAARMLGEHFGANLVHYGEVTDEDVFIQHGYANGMSPMIGIFRPASDGWGAAVVETYRTGQTSVCRDVNQEPTITAAESAQLSAAGLVAYVGVPLIKDGRWVAVLAVHFMTPHDWQPHEIALTEEVAERTWAAVERARSEAALRASEARYRTLFNEMDEAYAVVEMIADDAGRWVDFRFLEVNPAFVTHTSISDPVGRTVTELLGTPNPRWAAVYGQVAETGESVRFQEPEILLGRVFDLNVFRLGGPGSRKVAVLFSDITERKEVEAAIRLSAARDAYRVALADALRGEEDPVEVQGIATHLLGDFLQASRVVYGEGDRDSEETFTNYREYRRDGTMPTTIGRHRWDDFGEYVAAEMRAGQTLVVHDVRLHPGHSASELAAYGALGIESYLAVPLVREGRIVAFMAVNSSTTRAWTAEEIAITEETAERTWAAVRRARAEMALRQSEEKYRTIFDSIDEGFATLEVLYDDDRRPVDLRYLEVNRAFERQSGLAGITGRVTSEALPTLEPEWLETYARVARTGEPARFEQYVTDTERWFDVYMSRVGGEGGAVVATVFNDITERKRAAASLATVAARDAFLVQLADTLRSLSDPAEIEAETTRLLGEHLMVDRAYYVDIDMEAGRGRVTRDWVRSGAVSLTGEHRISDFGWSVEILRRGEFLVVSDTQTSPLVPPAERPASAALGIVACAGVPLIKGGRLLGALSVTVDEPRVWHDWELRLIEEVAGRAWSSIERARAESALRASETRFRLIVESASDYAIFTTDTEGRVVTWSPGAEGMLGWGAAEVVGESFALIFVPEDRAAGVPERELAVAADRGMAEDVRWHLNRSGARVFMEGSTRALYNDRGQLTGFLKVGQDVTVRRAIMEALRESVLRYRTLVENVRDYAIFLLNAEGMVTEWTDGAQRVMGYTSDEVLGQHVSLFYTPDDVAADEPARELAEAAETGRAEREGWRVCNGGERFWANEIATAVLDGDGVLAGFTMISRDLTDRRHVEEAAELVRAAADRDVLRRRLVMAEDDERRRLSRELHDEAGQHLTALALGLQALSDVAPPGSEVDRRAAELRALADTLGRELHAVAVRLRPRALDDFGLEAALTTYTEDWARQCGIAVDVHMRMDSGRLPGAVESTLYRIVQEALANVARHSGASRASVMVERRDRHVAAIVEDNGVGFETKGHAGTRGAGSGLGLLGMRERAALLGGSLDVESALGSGGTTVFVRLPVAHPDDVAPAAGGEGRGDG